MVNLFLFQASLLVCLNVYHCNLPDAKQSLDAVDQKRQEAIETLIRHFNRAEDEYERDYRYLCRYSLHLDSVEESVIVGAFAKRNEKRLLFSSLKELLARRIFPYEGLRLENFCHSRKSRIFLKIMNSGLQDARILEKGCRRMITTSSGWIDLSTE